MTGDSWEENRLLIKDRLGRIENQIDRIIAFGWRFFWLAIGGLGTLLTHAVISYRQMK